MGLGTRLERMINPDIIGDDADQPQTPVPVPEPETEVGGRVGPDPTRYGDWEKNGRCIDF